MKYDLWAVLQSLKSDDYVWVDLSHEVSPETPHHYLFPALESRPVLTLEEHGANTLCYSLVSQYGTHVDPPFHFLAEGRKLHEIAPRELVWPLCVLDVCDKVRQDPDYGVTVQDLLDWEAAHGRLPAGAFLAMRSGWSKRPNDAYDGKDAAGVAHNPGWTLEALRFLVEERRIGAIGHEAADTDPASVVREQGWVGERYFLSQDRLQIEMLTNLDPLPATGALLFAFYPRVKDGTGFTARCVAVFPK